MRLAKIHDFVCVTFFGILIMTLSGCNGLEPIRIAGTNGTWQLYSIVINDSAEGVVWQGRLGGSDSLILQLNGSEIEGIARAWGVYKVFAGAQDTVGWLLFSGFYRGRYEVWDGFTHLDLEPTNIFQFSVGWLYSVGFALRNDLLVGEYAFKNPEGNLLVKLVFRRKTGETNKRVVSDNALVAYYDRILQDSQPVALFRDPRVQHSFERMRRVLKTEFDPSS